MMYLAQVTFGPARAGGPSRDDLEELVHDYLGGLIKTGQVCGEYLCAWVGGVVNAYVNLARPDAYRRRHCSTWGKEKLARVRAAFSAEPAWRVIEDDVPSRFPTWRSATALYLATDAFGDASPVTRMDDGVPIPAYQLPLPDTEREYLYFWAEIYKAHDRVWLGCRDLEIPAYRQLAEPSSDLAKEGREYCALIEAKTSVPTYYYLMRYWGRKGKEDERLCPGCGGAWRVPGVSEEEPLFWRFPFKCDRCRLVSHRAASFDDQRHARIGEYRRPKAAGRSRKG